MKLRRWTSLLMFWFSAATNAAPLVTGTVSFDSSNGLYTYTYVIDSQELPARGFRSFAILVDPLTVYSKLPVAHFEPAGWEFYLSTGGYWDPPEIRIFGTFWQWATAENVNPGGDLTYSFTTPIAPDLGYANNYFVYSGSGAGPDELSPIISVGRSVGPVLGVVPEPTQLWLWLAGLFVFRVSMKRTAARQRLMNRAS